MKKNLVMLIIWAMAQYPAYPADSIKDPSEKGEKTGVTTSAQPSKSCGCPMEAAFQRLRESLQNPDARTRKLAATSLGRFPSSTPQIINLLVEATADGDREVRWAAITSLGQIGKQSTEVRDILKLFVRDRDSITAQKASLALANLGETDEDIIGALTRAMESASSDDAAIAVTATAKLLLSDDGRLLPIVLNGIKSKREALVLNSLKALKMAHTKDDKAVSELVRCYSDVDPKARVLIIEALSGMDEKSSHIKPVLSKGFGDPDPKVRKAAIQVAGKTAMATEIFKEQLLKALNDPERENRLTALDVAAGAGMLGKGHDKRILALRKDPDPVIRARAISVLGSLKTTTPEIMMALKSSLSDSSAEVRTSAVASLRNIGLRKPTDVIPILEVAFDSEKDCGIKDLIGTTLHQFGKGTFIAPVPPKARENTLVPGWEIRGQGS